MREHRTCPLQHPAALRGDIGTRGLNNTRALMVSTGLVLLDIWMLFVSNMYTVMVEEAG